MRGAKNTGRNRTERLSRPEEWEKVQKEGSRTRRYVQPRWRSPEGWGGREGVGEALPG